MGRLWSFFSFPMLTKELQEQAQQRRTYAIRFLYCLVLYLVVMYAFLPELFAVRDPMEQLGRGKDLFELMSSIQYWMILIFMPIIASGSIAHEKERNTLQLVLLTRLTPWNIVFEKFLSRVLTMFGFLLMALPILAVAYALGGVTASQVWTAFLTQVCLTLIVGAVSMACSAYSATAFGALLSSYLFLTPIAGCCSFLLIEMTLGSRAWGPVRNVGFQGQWILEAFLRCLPSLIVTSVILGYATNVLFERATVQPSHPLLRLFRWLDRAFHQINQNPVTRGTVVIRSVSTLPEMDGVAWRERTHSLAGSPTHLMRLFSLMMIPLSVVLFVAMTEPHAVQGSLGPIVVGMWTGALLLVFATSTPLILKEWNRQTLEVLLSVPISTEEILEQKRAGVRRLIDLFQVVLWLVLSFHIYLTHSDETWYFDFLILFTAGASLWLQLATVSWLGMLLGGWQRHLVRAMALGIIGVVLLWWVLPNLLVTHYVWPVVEWWHIVFYEESPKEAGWEWVGGALEIILSPLWILHFGGNYAPVWRNLIDQMPWALPIGLINQWVTYRLVRRWAIRRSKLDLPRLNEGDKSDEGKPSEGVQTSPAMGSP